MALKIAHVNWALKGQLRDATNLSYAPVFQAYEKDS